MTSTAPPAETTASPPATALSTRRQRELLQELQQLAHQRHAEEQRLEQMLHDGQQRAEQTYRQQVEQATASYQAEKQAIDQQQTAAREQLTSQYHDQRDQIQSAYHQASAADEKHYTQSKQEIEENYKHATWQALTVFDAAKNNPREELEAKQKALTQWQQELAQLRADAEELLQMRRLWRDDFANFASQIEQPASPQDESDVDADHLVAHLQAKMGEIRTAIDALQHNRRLALFAGFTPVGLAVALWLVLTVLVCFLTGGNHWLSGVSLSTTAAAVLLGWGGKIVWQHTVATAANQYQNIINQLASSHNTIEQAATAAHERSRRHAQRLVEERDTEIAAACTLREQSLNDLETWVVEQREQLNQKYPAELTRLRELQQRGHEEVNQRFRDRLQRLEEQHHQALHQAEETQSQALTNLQETHQQEWSLMRQAWFAGGECVREEIAAMQTVCHRFFPDWNKTNYANWTSPDTPVEAIQFGTLTVDLAKLQHALSKYPDLHPQVTTLTIPALLTLQEQPSCVATVTGEGRAAGVALLQTLLVHFLTAMPPGKVRFTLCDPVGLGASFSSFMHLADYDETLISGRIWSESHDIDEQLARLTNHMETVLQKYLRNEYDTIHAYNVTAGEMAEPFHVLAIANFPHGFSDAAAQRLRNLLTGGPRCGVYVLLSIDQQQRLPHGLALDELTAPSVHLDWKSDQARFVWETPTMARLPLTVSPPIHNQALLRVLKQAGQRAKDSIRVEVPFDIVVPADKRYWQETCDQELQIPIGRSGAKRVHAVRLGKGTSQHLLVAGKTGSGKSTFLHALITSAALHYAPEQVQFYLVDFKKGVEFKSYATCRLPHAQVIAIESEREFGLSVLERLDHELHQRGEKFRAAGVQNVADYRAAHPEEAMPRVLLVMDEFQELFVEDDKLAQQASLFLDRLVRQGRAFGIHVVLGTQTLSGAYSLARSTLGQIAVRVALPCSEADAHLILSDERNQAARFLHRPGEAIYNDQNGMVAGNQPLQVVWLPDSQRTSYLKQISTLVKENKLTYSEPLVFEGNAPADPQNNPVLQACLTGTGIDAKDNGTGTNGERSTAWLGSAVSIRPATSVTFSAHAGCNFLMVGQQADAAQGVLTTMAISLAAQLPTRASWMAEADAPRAPLLVFDGTRPGETGEGVWSQVVAALGSRAELVSQRHLERTLNQVAAELARREEQNDAAAVPLYLVISHAVRFRELRKSEDDFSFSRDRDQPPAPDQQLAEILKNGPHWGIHTLVWCDSYNAMTRLFDRQRLREFETRVAFQMSAADSSNLLDTPAAAQLSPHRALLYHDETGQVEKFRPYAEPTAEWLQTVTRYLVVHH